jgi:frataxin-like iron-binding protein CyaY
MVLFLTACKKDPEVTTPEFEVVVETTTFKAGEEVQFNFEGDPNQISFYSGEPLHDYSVQQNRIVETLGILTSFRTNLFYNDQPGMFSVWLSTDYNGGNTYDDVTNATWKNDVSQRFKIAAEDNTWGSATNFPSGTVNLVEAMEEGKPLYIGFKYNHRLGTGVPRNWYVYNFNVDATTLFEQEKLFSNFLPFSLVYDHNFTTTAHKASSINASGSTITFTTPAAVRSKSTEIWAISPPIFLKKTELGPDRPVSIKGFRNPKVSSYKHTYTTPGTYTATFVAFNSNVYGAKEIVKQVEITITN